MSSPGPGLATELLGVYDADAGIRGETAYVVGKLLGRRHCGLCDITHAVRRKPAWDDLVAGSDVPLRVVHRNELEDAEARAVAASGLPVVLAVLGDGRHVPLLRAEELDACGGDVERFKAALEEALDRG